jgi:hypothetical protein
MTTEHIQKTFLLLKRCIKVTLTIPTAVFLHLIIIGVEISAIGFLLIYEYQQYGIHIFDFSTLQTLIHFNFWNHISHIVALFIITVATIFIKRALEFSLSFTLTEELRGSRISLLTSLITPFRSLKELFRITFIETFGSFSKITDILSIGYQAKKAKKLCEGTLEDEYDEYNAPSGMLLIPITVEEKLHITQGLKLSEQMMEKKFGKNIQYNYMPLHIQSCAVFLIISVSFIIVHFTLHHDVFPTILIASIVSLIITNSINNSFMILNAATYNHLSGKPIRKFSYEDIASLFVNKSRRVLFITSPGDRYSE